MIVKGVRLYGKNDLRLDTYTLPVIGENEILAEVVTDSMCMSTYKGVIQGSDHKRIPDDIAKNPIVIGHEFAGRIIKVGSKASGTFRPGDHFTIQPNINYKGIGYAPGYSFPYFGGNATHIIIPAEVMEQGFLLHYQGDSFFKASLTEPISCLYAAFAASYHMAEDGKTHTMGLKENGSLAILGGCGPMGLGAIDLALNLPKGPSLVIVTDVDEDRVARAKELFPSTVFAEKGKKIVFVNTAVCDDAVTEIKELAGGGLDDVLIMVPLSSVVEQADAIAGNDCCINFFSGPIDKDFSASVNFYDVHYTGKHILGTSGSDTDDMRASLRLIERTGLDPSVMVTHIGGLNCVADSVINLPKLRSGKILVYVNLDLPLTAIEDFGHLGEESPLFRDLYGICVKNNLLWNAEAEAYLLAHGQPICQNSR